MSSRGLGGYSRRLKDLSPPSHVNTRFPVIRLEARAPAAADYSYLPLNDDSLKSYNATRKPKKLYLENTNLIAAITAPHRVEPSTGTVRETFFCAALRPQHVLKSLGGVDFLVDDHVAVEVGGPGKGDHQLQKKKVDPQMRRVLAIDGIEAGSGQRIPLHLFGLLR